MKWSDLTGVVGKLAPLVGGALGGPAGATIGALVADVLGVDCTPDAVAEALKSDPEAAIKLRALQNEERENLRQHAFKNAELEVKDRQGAREAHKHSNMPGIICITLTAMVAAGAGLLFFANIPAENETLANMLFGALLAKWGDSIAYWVGTTRGSAQKTLLAGR